MSSPDCLNHALRRDELSAPEQRMLPAMRVNPSAGRLPRRVRDDERLRQAAVSVLETMFYRFVEVPGNLVELPVAKGRWLRSSVTFSGAFSGSVVCWLPQTLAETLTRDFLGLSEEDAVDESQRTDLVAEFSNMICGRWLSTLQHPIPFELTHPEVVTEAGSWRPSEAFLHVPEFGINVDGETILVGTIGEK
jgi:CheY-specific phosphatase CheX